MSHEQKLIAKYWFSFMSLSFVIWRCCVAAGRMHWCIGLVPYAQDMQLPAHHTFACGSNGRGIKTAQMRLVFAEWKTISVGGRPIGRHKSKKYAFIEETSGMRCWHNGTLRVLSDCAFGCLCRNSDVMPFAKQTTDSALNILSDGHCVVVAPGVRSTFYVYIFILQWHTHQRISHNT